MKRNLQQMSSIARFTRSKRPKLEPPLSFKRPSRQWISATATKNYIMNDGLIDYLKLFHKTGIRTEEKFDSFTSFVIEKGKEFEREIVRYISENCVECVTIGDVINDENVKKTKELMVQGVPVIHSAPVRNVKDRTHGIIDLLVRSDFLGHLVENCPLREEETTIRSPRLGADYHYVIIDIKYSTLPLRADGVHLLNEAKYRAYKAQLYIYNRAIAVIQGYEPPCAYILGRRWRYKSKGEVFSNMSCLNKLGVVEFTGVDSDFPAITRRAIQWVKDVRSNGQKWGLDPPSRDELYPNMCSTGAWDSEKKELAEKLGELTMLWYCGVNQRKTAFSNGVKSWRDPRCSAELMGVRGQRAPIIDQIIEINRDNVGNILPRKIETGLYGWRSEREEVFVDFETIIDVCAPMDELPEQRKTDMIFMIGVGFVKNRRFKYKSFVARSMTGQEEYRIMQEFFEFMKGMNFPKMWFWHAEERFWDAAERRQFELDFHDLETREHISDDWKLLGDWVDLADIFRAEPIVVKGCFGFGLKHIADGFRSHGLIKARIESECDSGNVAMIKALEAYEKSSDPPNSPVMKDIELYNKFDCEVLHDILSYLRKNH